MALAPGTRLGPYEIVAPLGAGGMGEVYRARDASLGRDVAIKVLPEAFAQDADRLARFEREAKTLAALNHPNVAHVYGFEQADGVRALVMELVEGPTLADRIAQGVVPLDEALPVARQIAEALEAAHEQGIIHRDLKPANVKVRADGTVKVLDFGLAKALGPPEDRHSATATSSPLAMTHSPTLTSPVGVTGIGMILGTAAYMAPEQAKGGRYPRQAIYGHSAVYSTRCSPDARCSPETMSRRCSPRSFVQTLIGVRFRARHRARSEWCCGIACTKTSGAAGRTRQA
jgi:serine/threonine protein kinase